MWIKIKNKYSFRGEFYYQWPFINVVDHIFNTIFPSFIYNKTNFNLKSINHFIFYIKRTYRNNGDIRVYFICG